MYPLVPSNELIILEYGRNKYSSTSSLSASRNFTTNKEKWRPGQARIPFT